MNNIERLGNKTNTEQLLPDNEARVWTADEGKTPCEGQSCYADDILDICTAGFSVESGSVFKTLLKNQKKHPSSHNSHP